MRLFARTLIGLAIAADFAIATACRVRAQEPARAAGHAQQRTITVGVLISYLVALIIFSVFPGSTASTGWRMVLGREVTTTR